MRNETTLVWATIARSNSTKLVVLVEVEAQEEKAHPIAVRPPN